MLVELQYSFQNLVPPLIWYAHLFLMCQAVVIVDGHLTIYRHAAFSSCCHSKFMDWLWILLGETCFGHQTESHYELLCGTKSPVALPLHISLPLNRTW